MTESVPISSTQSNRSLQHSFQKSMIYDQTSTLKPPIILSNPTTSKRTSRNTKFRTPKDMYLHYCNSGRKECKMMRNRKELLAHLRTYHGINLDQPNSLQSIPLTLDSETLSSQQQQSSEKKITLHCNKELSQHLVGECRNDDAKEKVDAEMESIESSMKKWTWNDEEKCWELMKNGQIDGEGNDEVDEECDDGVDQLNGLDNLSNIESAEAESNLTPYNQQQTLQHQQINLDQFNPNLTQSTFSNQTRSNPLTSQPVPSSLDQFSVNLVKSSRESRIDDFEEKVDAEMESIESSMKWTWNEVEKCWELTKNDQIDRDEGNDEVGEECGDDESEVEDMDEDDQHGFDQLNRIEHESSIEVAVAPRSLRPDNMNISLTTTQSQDPLEFLNDQPAPTSSYRNNTIPFQLEKSFDDNGLHDRSVYSSLPVTLDQSNLNPTHCTLNESNPISINDNQQFKSAIIYDESNIDGQQQLYQQPVLQVTELDKSTNQSVNCPKCDKSFQNKQLLYGHTYNVHPKQVYKCGISGCGKIVKMKHVLFRHYRLMHEKVNLPCNQCKMLKKRKDLFLLHLRTCHQIDCDVVEQQHQIIELNESDKEQSDVTVSDPNNQSLQRTGQDEMNFNELAKLVTKNEFDNRHSVDLTVPELHSQLSRHHKLKHQHNQPTRPLTPLSNSNILQSNPLPDLNVSSSLDQFTTDLDQTNHNSTQFTPNQANPITFQSNVHLNQSNPPTRVSTPSLDTHNESTNTSSVYDANNAEDERIADYHVNIDSFDSQPSGYQLSVECFECGNWFKNEKSLSSHRLYAHSKQLCQCEVSGCGMVFKTCYFLMQHYYNEQHNGVNFPCDQCKLFTKRKDLMLHQQTHHAINFDYQQSEHQDNETAQSKQNGQVVVPDKSTDKHVCEECGKSLKTRSNLVNHIRTHTGEKPFACTWKDCGKAFAEHGNLKNHIRTHTGEKPFICPWEDCHKAFGLKETMKLHHMAHIVELPSDLTGHTQSHTKERLIACPRKDCGKTFASKTNLKRHLNESHAGKLRTNIKQHHCEYCDKKFRDSTHLTDHIRIHTGEKPFKCSWKDCEKTFNQKSALKTHFIRHSIKSIRRETISKGILNLASDGAQSAQQQQQQQISINSLDNSTTLPYPHQFNPGVIQQEEQFVDLVHSLKPNTIPEVNRVLP